MAFVMATDEETKRHKSRVVIVNDKNKVTETLDHASKLE
jgi:aspartate 1-decarboxylase